MRNIYIYMLVMLFSSCFYMCDVSNSKNESTDFVIEIEHLPKIQSMEILSILNQVRLLN